MPSPIINIFSNIMSLGTRTSVPQVSASSSLSGLELPDVGLSVASESAQQAEAVSSSATPNLVQVLQLAPVHLPPQRPSFPKKIRHCLVAVLGLSVLGGSAAIAYVAASSQQPNSSEINQNASYSVHNHSFGDDMINPNSTNLTQIRKPNVSNLGSQSHLLDPPAYMFPIFKNSSKKFQAIESKDFPVQLFDVSQMTGYAICLNDHQARKSDMEVEFYSSIESGVYISYCDQRGCEHTLRGSSTSLSFDGFKIPKFISSKTEYIKFSEYHKLYHSDENVTFFLGKVDNQYAAFFYSEHRHDSDDKICKETHAMLLESFMHIPTQHCEAQEQLDYQSYMLIPRNLTVKSMQGLNTTGQELLNICQRDYKENESS